MTNDQIRERIKLLLESCEQAPRNSIAPKGMIVHEAVEVAELLQAFQKHLEWRKQDLKNLRKHEATIRLLKDKLKLAGL